MSQDVKHSCMPQLAGHHCLPASRVSIINSAGSKVWPSWRPWPETRTRLASPISDWLITTGMGLLATCWPFFFTCTRCSPVSLGTNEIPGHGARSSIGVGVDPQPSSFLETLDPFSASYLRGRYAAASVDRAPLGLKEVPQWQSAG
jgi:hypothetical protein